MESEYTARYHRFESSRLRILSKSQFWEEVASAHCASANWSALTKIEIGVIKKPPVVLAAKITIALGVSIKELLK